MTSAFQFVEASKEKAKARMALVGPSGSGKTYTALRLAKAFGGPIAVVDTERGSASKYSGKDGFQFKTLNLNHFDPRKFPELMAAAADVCVEGTLIVDSFTAWWSGQGGMIDLVDSVAGASKSNNSFVAWGKVKPVEKAMFDSLLAFPGHVIVTMRSKTEYVIDEDERGKKTPRKVGLAPEQRANVEYEFDIVGDMNQDNTMAISKSRCKPIREVGAFRQPGADLATMVLEWLEEGTDRAALASAAAETLRSFQARIAEATTIEALDAVGAAVKQAHSDGDLDEGARRTLGRDFSQRKRSLAATVPQVEQGST